MWTYNLVSINPINKSPVKTNILQRIDSLSRLLNLAANSFRDQLRGELRKRAASGLALNDLSHLLPNGANLGRPRISRLLDLVGASLREGNGE